MLPMQSIINIIWIFIMAEIKHHLTKQTETANNKYSFEYLLLVVTR